MIAKARILRLTPAEATIVQEAMQRYFLEACAAANQAKLAGFEALKERWNHQASVAGGILDRLNKP